MKKTFFALCCGALFMTAACGSKSSASTEGFTAEQIAMGDTVALSLGTDLGSNIINSMNQMPEDMKAKFDKDEFYNALVAVLNVDTANIAYLQGLQYGLQLYGMEQSFPERFGVPFDREKFLAALKGTLAKDSITPEEMAAHQGEMMKLNERMQQLSEEKRVAEIKEKPEYKKNTADGEKYAKEMLAKGFKKSASGLVYKIENEGTGAKVSDSDRAKVIYKGTLTDGTVFDESKEGAEFMPGQVVPGFGEAIKMLGKGGKATVVIPGNLAYGDMGRGGQIGPNQTLVFEIEIADITPANAPQAQ